MPKEQTAYPAPAEAVYSTYKPGTVYPVDSRAKYRNETRKHREIINQHRDRHRRLVRWLVAPTLLLGVNPQLDSNSRSNYTFGFGLGLGVAKHFARVFGIQSRFVTNFFVLFERDHSYIDDIPAETGLDLSLDATAVIGPFGVFFLEAGLVGSYRVYFRDNELVDDDDQYSWTRLPAKPDEFSAGGVGGLGFMLGDKSQYVLGGRLLFQPEYYRLVVFHLYFAYAFGSTGEDGPAKN